MPPETCVEIRSARAISDPGCIMPDMSIQEDCASCRYKSTNPHFKKER